MAFPFPSVIKRINDNEHDFIYGVFYAVKDRLESGDYLKREDED